MNRNPLTDVLPPGARKVLYAVLFVLSLIFAAWQASQGDWLEFAGGLVSSLLGATAASNIKPVVPGEVVDQYGPH